MTLRNKKIKQYEGVELADIKEEDRRIIEILRRLDEEYGLGDNLKNALKIENWCKTNYGEKEIWDRKLPSLGTNDGNEIRLAKALKYLRAKTKNYEGQNHPKIENDEDRKIVEIISELDEEYAYGEMQLHYNLGQALKIENWCKTNYGEKEIWNRKLPSSHANDDEEKKLGTFLIKLRGTLKKYEGKRQKEIENDEDRQILEIIDRLDREYNSKKIKLNNAKNSRDSAKIKNAQAKELERQVSEQLKKRGQAHEEQ